SVDAGQAGADEARRTRSGGRDFVPRLSTGTLAGRRVRSAPGAPPRRACDQVASRIRLEQRPNRTEANSAKTGRRRDQTCPRKWRPKTLLEAKQRRPCQPREREAVTRAAARRSS